MNRDTMSPDLKYHICDTICLQTVKFGHSR